MCVSYKIIGNSPTSILETILVCDIIILCIYIIYIITYYFDKSVSSLKKNLHLYNLLCAI